jgi:hypothetical protein
MAGDVASSGGKLELGASAQRGQEQQNAPRHFPHGFEIELVRRVAPAMVMTYSPWGIGVGPRWDRGRTTQNLSH